MLFVSCILNYVLIQMLSFSCRLWVTKPKTQPASQITERKKCGRTCFESDFSPSMCRSHSHTVDVWVEVQIQRCNFDTAKKLKERKKRTKISAMNKLCFHSFFPRGRKKEINRLNTECIILYVCLRLNSSRNKITH